MRQRIFYSLGGINLIAAAVALDVIGVLALFSRPEPQPEIECYVGQTQAMTVQEVATLLKITLVELKWLPQNLKITPEISTSPSYYSDPKLSRCSVTIEYPKPGTSSHDNLVFLSLYPYGNIQSTKTPTRCSWQFSPSGPLGTDCSIEIDGMKSTLRVSFNLSDDIPPEDALKIRDGIRVVEPQE